MATIFFNFFKFFTRKSSKSLQKCRYPGDPSSWSILQHRNTIYKCFINNPIIHSDLLCLHCGCCFFNLAGFYEWMKRYKICWIDIHTSMILRRSSGRASGIVTLRAAVASGCYAGFLFSTPGSPWNCLLFYPLSLQPTISVLIILFGLYITPGQDIGGCVVIK